MIIPPAEGPHPTGVALGRSNTAQQELLHHLGRCRAKQPQEREAVPDEDEPGALKRLLAPARIGDSRRSWLRQQGLGTPASTYSHRSRNPTAGGGSLKSIPEVAVSGAAMKLTHAQHWVGSTRRSEKKWRNKATEGRMPIMASQTKAKTERRVLDSGPRCIMWI